MTLGSVGGRFAAINGVDQAGADALLKPEELQQLDEVSKLAPEYPAGC